MKIKQIAMASAAALTMTGCIIVNKGTTVSKETTVGAPPSLEAKVIGGEPKQYVPKAVIYRMSGDATAANVPVQVNSKGEILSFPDPTDLIGQEPVELADGYLLDRRGIGNSSRFTEYTYAEYAGLKQAPTVADLKAAIIPDARAVDIRTLSMTTSEAVADTAAVNRIIRSLR